MAGAAFDSSLREGPPRRAANAPARRDERRVGLLALCLLALAIGIVTGVGAVVLRALIGLIHNASFHGMLTYRYDANILEGPSRWGDWVFFSPIVGGLIVVWLVQKFAPEAKGHGVPEVMDSIFYKDGDIRWQVAVIKSLASALSIGTRRGGRAGRTDHPDRRGARLGLLAGHPPRALAKGHPALGRRRRGDRGDLQHAARRGAVRPRNPAAGSVQPDLPAGRDRHRRGHPGRPDADRPGPGLQRAGNPVSARPFLQLRGGVWPSCCSARSAASPPGPSSASSWRWRTVFQNSPAARTCRISSAWQSIGAMMVGLDPHVRPFLYRRRRLRRHPVGAGQHR